MEDFENTHPSKIGNKVFNEPYSEERIEKLYNLLLKFERNERSKTFSIIVDGETIVPTTNQTDQFYDFMEYVEPTTRVVEIRFYYSHSKNCNKYVFHLGELPLNGFQQRGQQIDPIDVELKISEALQKQKIETELDFLRRKTRKQKEKIKILSDELESKNINVKELLTQGLQLYGAFKQKDIPQLSTLEGTPEKSDVEIVPLSLADQKYRQLKNQIGEDYLLQIIATWETLSKYPELKTEINELINSKTDQ